MRWFTELSASRRKLPPFFRSTLAYEIRAVREEEWESKEFKVMCYVISVGEPKDMDERLYRFARGVLDSEFYNCKIYKEAFEEEQISRDEISPAKLLRAYAEVDDEPVYEADLY